MIYWSLRRDDLCIPQGCDKHIDVRDTDGFLVRRERCDDCPLDKLDQAVATTPVLPRIYDLEFATSLGIKITFDEVNAQEFRALKILRTERDKYQAERIQKDQRNR